MIKKGWELPLFWTLFWVFFSALTLLVGPREGHLDRRQTCFSYPLSNTKSRGHLSCRWLGHPSQFQLLSHLGSVTAWQLSSERQPNFAALNRGRHLCSAGRPSGWALAHILVSFLMATLCRRYLDKTACATCHPSCRWLCGILLCCQRHRQMSRHTVWVMWSHHQPAFISSSSSHRLMSWWRRPSQINNDNNITALWSHSSHRDVNGWLHCCYVGLASEAATCLPSAGSVWWSDQVQYVTGLGSQHTEILHHFRIWWGQQANLGLPWRWPLSGCVLSWMHALHSILVL